MGCPAWATHGRPRDGHYSIIQRTGSTQVLRCWLVLVGDGHTSRRKRQHTVRRNTSLQGTPQKVPTQWHGTPQHMRGPAWPMNYPWIVHARREIVCDRHLSINQRTRCMQVLRCWLVDGHTSRRKRQELERCKPDTWALQAEALHHPW